MISKQKNKELWVGVWSNVLRMLFGDNHKTIKFTRRLDRAFLNAKETIIQTCSWVFIIYGLLYIGETRIVEVTIGLYLGFSILFRIFFEVYEAITVDEDP